MGYDLHLTRAASWKENAGCEIGSSEWLEVATGDPELSLDPVHGPYAVTWSSKRGGHTGWFDWSEGNVYTTDPSRECVRKILALAATLKALVQGDDGEVYESEREWRGGG